jgi:hypothetical protein
MRRSPANSSGATIGRITPILPVMLLCGLVLDCPKVVEAQAQMIDDPWAAGENGLWNKGGNWGNGVPNNGGGKTYNVSIIDGKSAVTVQGIDPTINNLTLAKGNTLNVGSGYSLSIVGTGSGVGSVNNAGMINLASILRPTQLIVTGDDGTVTLTGGGTISLSGRSPEITASTGNATLNNVNNTIQGAGTIGSGNLQLLNGGAIVANQSGEPLTISPNNKGLNNTGKLEATAGGNLQLDGTCTNSSTIQADGLGPKGNIRSVVNLNGSVINTKMIGAANGGWLVLGGTYTNTSSGIIQAAGKAPNGASSPVDLTGNGTNAGTIKATNGGSLDLWKGICTNTGGTILADGAEGAQKPIATFATLNGSTINGGTLMTRNGGIIVSNAATLNGVTISKDSVVNAFSNTTLQRTIANSGKVTVDGKGNTLDGAGATFNNQAGASLSFKGGGTGTIGTLNNQGGGMISIDGDGTKLTATQRIENLGTVTVSEKGATLDVTRASLTNQVGASLSFAGGSKGILPGANIVNLGTVTVEGKGTTLDGTGAAFSNRSGASLSFTGGSTGTIGTLNNRATVSFTGGSVGTIGTLSNRATVSFTGGSTGTVSGTITNRGEVAVGGKGTTLLGTEVDNQGGATISFTGGSRGTIGSLDNRSFATVSFTGGSIGTISGLSNESNATVSIDGAGSKLTSPLTDNYGAVQVSGKGATLDGVAAFANRFGASLSFTGGSTGNLPGALIVNWGTVTVDGKGTTLNGKGATVSNQDGALLWFKTGGTGTIGTVNNEGGARTSFTGGSIGTIDNFNNLTGATLSLRSGSQVTIGNLNNQPNAVVTIDGAGTKLTAKAGLRNAGRITETNNGKLDPPTLSGAGRLELYTGSSATLGNYTMNTGGALIVDKTSLLQISGGWTNQLRDPTQFRVDGKVEVNGGGVVQNIEVVGRDHGNTMSANAVAFANNFNIGSSSAPTGTLQIDAGSHVMLVDQFDNGNRGGFGSQTSPVTWTGSPTGAEALYVWNLVIQPDVTLDFNGLHLYYERGASGGVGPDPSVWYADLAIWKAQGDVFIGGEPILIPMAIGASVPEPSGLILAGTALACLSAGTWYRRSRTAGTATCRPPSG